MDSCKEVFGGSEKIMSCEPQNDLVNKCYILFFINVTKCVPNEVNPTTVGGKKKNKVEEGGRFNLVLPIVKII